MNLKLEEEQFYLVIIAAIVVFCVYFSI